MVAVAALNHCKGPQLVVEALLLPANGRLDPGAAPRAVRDAIAPRAKDAADHAPVLGVNGNDGVGGNSDRRGDVPVVGGSNQLAVCVDLALVVERKETSDEGSV